MRILTALAATVAALALTTTPAHADDSLTDEQVVSLVENECSEMTCAGLDLATSQRYCAITDGGGAGFEEWCDEVLAAAPEPSKETSAVDPFEGVETADLTADQILAMVEQCTDETCGVVREDALVRYCDLTDGGNSGFEEWCTVVPTAEPDPIEEPVATESPETQAHSESDATPAQERDGFPIWLAALIGIGIGIGVGPTSAMQRRRRKRSSDEEA